MTAAVTGKPKIVGSHHWTSGPLAVVPARVHAQWAAFTEADGKALRKHKKRISLGDGVFFPKFGVVGLYQQRGVLTFVEAVDEEGRAPTPLAPILRAATQADVERPWKHVADYRIDEPHVLADAWAKDIHGEGKRDRKKKVALSLATGDYVIEELRDVKQTVQPEPNKRAQAVTYAFTRIRPAGAPPRAAKAKASVLGPTELAASADVIKRSKRLKFVDNDQTCSVVLPRARLAAWSGLDPNADGTTDFARACAVNGVGLIDVGGAQALVIGSDYAAAHYPTKTGALLVMWAGADSAAGVLATALAIPETAWKKSKLRWKVTDGALVLIGAPTPGRAATKRGGHFQLTRGTYAIETCWRHAADVRIGTRIEASGVAAIRLTRC